MMRLPEIALHANRHDSNMQKKRRDKNDKNGTKPNEGVNQQTDSEASSGEKLSQSTQRRNKAKQVYTQ